jgi:hypothetical protein
VKHQKDEVGGVLFIITDFRNTAKQPKREHLKSSQRVEICPLLSFWEKMKVVVFSCLVCLVFEVL